MKLYEITAEIELLWESAHEILSSEKTTTQEREQALADLETKLKQTEGTHADKCIQIACLIKNIEADAQAIKSEEERLSARRKVEEKKSEWLRTYLANNMEPGTNLRDSRAVIGWRKSTAVEVAIAPELLPENLRRTKTVVEADKAAIKINLEAGQAVEGCSLVQRFNLQIK